MRRWFFILAILIGLFGKTAAQSGGQFCVRSFEDRNRSGQRDGGEPLLTRGISVNLQDSSSVTIASALLDDSPTAIEGVVCFEGLPAGQYTVTVTSADYEPTTTNTFTTSVNDTGQPAIFTFGAQPAAAVATGVPAQAGDPLRERDQLARIVLAGLGALVVVFGMVVLGLIVYWLAFRRRPLPATVIDPRRTTGSIPRVHVLEQDDDFTRP